MIFALTQIGREVAFGDVIGYWLSVIGSIAKQRKPKSFTIHYSLFTKSWDSNPTLQNFRKFALRSNANRNHPSSIIHHPSSVFGGGRKW